MSARTHAYYIHVQDTVPLYAQRTRRVLRPALRALRVIGKYLWLTVVFLAAIIFGFLTAGKG